MSRNYKSIIEAKAYDFIRTEEVLGKQIIYLTLSGSIGYGTDNENSDVDLRGVTIETDRHLYGLNAFEQYEENETDTVIYGLKKFVSLAAKGNPNILELLGTNEEHIIQMTEAGRYLRANAGLFLSKRIIETFGNYASAQLRRLQNALARDHYPQIEKEKHILSTLNNQMTHFKSNYHSFDHGQIHLYESESDKKELESEIFMDIDLKKYPLRDFTSIYSEMNNVVRNYAKLNHRNRKKSELKLNKHAMHLIRLLLMGKEILETGIIRTYREEDHDLLMGIRNGDYAKEEIFDMTEKYEKVFYQAAEKTHLTDAVDEEAIDDLLIQLYTLM